MTKTLIGLFVLSCVSFTTPLSAEVTDLDGDHFVIRTSAVVEADTKTTWLALISPSRWWSDEHTWSADAANLSLTPQAGGCFCERIPEVEDANRITLEGSVEHMRVIQAYPERALRMQGSLGPLQSEPVTGILTVTLSEVETGTRIVWEYNVGGPMRYDASTIAIAVDGVLTQQLTGLADLLGPVETPDTSGKKPAPEAKNASDSENDRIAEPGDGVVADGGANDADAASVADAFTDLTDD